MKRITVFDTGKEFLATLGNAKDLVEMLNSGAAGKIFFRIEPVSKDLKGHYFTNTLFWRNSGRKNRERLLNLYSLGEWKLISREAILLETEEEISAGVDIELKEFCNALNI